MRPRRRGRRGGVIERQRRRSFKLPMPSIILCNAQSLRNKTNELEACARYMREFRDANLMCFSETWFSDNDTDPDIPGFTVIRSDRSREITGKKSGGGVCIFVNRRWCTDITVKKVHCCNDIELLSVSLRPFYLPREFQRVFVTVVYIQPNADSKAAADKIREVIQEQETACPDSIRLVMGDFNKCRLTGSLPNYRQYITCTTCNGNILDQCYGNIPRAYRCVQLPTLGRSIHNMVSLVPVYKSRLKSSKAKKRTIKKWTEEASQTLNACFDCTDWDVFFESSSSLEEATEAVTEYINFCTDMLIPARDVRIFPNGKPWVTKDIADLLKQRQCKHRDGDMEGVRSKQKEIKAKIRQNKIEYKKKLEQNFSTNNSRQMWQGVSVMTGYKPSKNSVKTEDAQALADELNTFYARFDKFNFKSEQETVLHELKSREGFVVQVEEAEVRMCFKCLNTRSAPGPDGITGRLLRTCRDSLSDVFTRLFRWSLSDGQVPTLWKTATVIPVPKKPSPKMMNDYRPVALTSVPFKCLEKLVLRHLMIETEEHQDPHQFAYQANRSCEDAINTLLHKTYHHLEKPGTYVRILFLDFSSAFNTIQPHLMVRKLLRMEVNPTLIQWVYSFLTNRPQRVKITSPQEVCSGVIKTNTGAPQGCVLSPALFTLYTSDCRCKSDGVLQVKFSDDTSISGLVSGGDQTAYRAAVADMTSWCGGSFLELNVTKTKEMIVDFRKNPPPLTPLIINGETVEDVKQYRYLGTVLDCKLDWSVNSVATLKKANQRLHFLKKLRSFDVKPAILRMFYQATVESIATYNSLCYFGNLRAMDLAKLVKITKTASCVIGLPVPDLKAQYEKKLLRRVRAILGDPKHPLHSELASHRSTREASGRLRSTKARTKRFHQAFVPSAIRIFNSKI